MKNTFKLLKDKKNNIYSNTSEYAFFAENSDVLLKYMTHYRFRSFDDSSFKLIQANILIKAILNKELIESNIPYMDKKNMKEQVEKLLIDGKCPCFEFEGSKIYIPIYSRGLNFIYLDEPKKLLAYPYNELKDEPLSTCIDLLDVYNISLYDSSFTNLIKISQDKTSAAFYHYEFETIYIINDQGRLDISIKLFDRHIKNKDMENLEDRLKDVVSKFYSNNRNDFVKSMYLNKFISLKTYKKLQKKITLRQIKKTTYARKAIN